MTCQMTHWTVDKLGNFMKQYWWGNISKATKKAQLTSALCPKYNPGKIIQNALGHFDLPKRAFEVCQMDFIQLSPSQGYKFGFVMICMFSHWIGALPCQWATNLAIVKIFLEKIISTWVCPQNCIMTEENILLAVL